MCDNTPPPRCFLAVDLDAAFIDEAVALAGRLRRAPGLLSERTRWCARDTMHITLRFFGPTAPAHVDVLRDLTTSLASGAPSLRLRASALTGFPDPARARILVLELAPVPLLTGFAERAEAVAVSLGFSPEPRAYRPHLTLARTKVPADVRAHAADAARLPEAHATAITLYASTTGPAGPVYTPLARAPLPTP